MTEEESSEVLARLLQKYGDDLPDPEHYPQIFSYLVKLYLRELRLENANPIWPLRRIIYSCW